jgi:salicylate hydroxylase
VTIGDASHPSLPYQAQGAAMAVEDGVILGTLLGRLQSSMNISCEEKVDRVHDILVLFESLRKKRTTLNVRGAIANRHMFHMEDGSEQEQRDRELSEVDWINPCRWQWADMGYQRRMLGFESVKETEKAFAAWLKGQRTVQASL